MERRRSTSANEPKARSSGGSRGSRRRKEGAPDSALLGPPTGENGAAGVARALADAAGSVAGPLVSAARPVVETVTHPVESVESVARPVVAGAVRRWRESGPGRVGQLRARAKQPLPSLWGVHPEARQALPRELGLQTIPLDRIRGTAVEGPVQRGGDFLPIERLRGSNWLARWQRLRRAVERLQILPPIDVIRYGDDHWVVDGHNRVAAALYTGQVAIDASVIELRPPGHRARATEDVPSLAQVAEEGRELRALGQGRFSRTASSGRSFVELRTGLERRGRLERRSAADRRKDETAPPGEERRSGHDRRSGSDRRTGSERRSERGAPEAFDPPIASDERASRRRESDP